MALLKIMAMAVFNVNYKDAYQFFLKWGRLSNSNTEPITITRVNIWNEYITHDTYDAYWKARNIRTHFKQVKPAALVVGGWFDAEDLFGALETYRAIEKKNPVIIIHLSWGHGPMAHGQGAI